VFRRSLLLSAAAIALKPAHSRTVETFSPSCILRPDRNGKWFIYEDETHACHGFAGITQTKEYVRVHFSGSITGWRKYTKAGVVQVSTDDGLAGSVLGSANLGLGSVTIYLRAYPRIRARDPVIDPATVWRYAPDKGNGNLWVSVSNMLVGQE